MFLDLPLSAWKKGDKKEESKFKEKALNPHGLGAVLQEAQGRRRAGARGRGDSRAGLRRGCRPSRLIRKPSRPWPPRLRRPRRRRPPPMPPRWPCVAALRLLIRTSPCTPKLAARYGARTTSCSSRTGSFSGESVRLLHGASVSRQ